MNNPLKIDWQAYAPDPGLFEDRVILVTGAAGGIGEAVTTALAEAGATVIMLDRKLRHMEKIYDRITAIGQPEPVLLPQDLLKLDSEACDTIRSGIETDFGRLGRNPAQRCRTRQSRSAFPICPRIVDRGNAGEPVRPLDTDTCTNTTAGESRPGIRHFHKRRLREGTGPQLGRLCHRLRRYRGTGSNLGSRDAEYFERPVQLY